MSLVLGYGVSEKTILIGWFYLRFVFDKVALEQDFLKDASVFHFQSPFHHCPKLIYQHPLGVCKSPDLATHNHILAFHFSLTLQLAGEGCFLLTVKTKSYAYA
jgi:hypothetical protein